MSEISETEIKAMTKEQNYMRGYKDGKSDVLDKISAEIDRINSTDYGGLGDYEVHSAVEGVKQEILDLVEKYKKEGAK